MHSDGDPEDMETASIEELIVKIEKAAKNHMIYAPPPSSNTVHFWCLQVVGALQASMPQNVQLPPTSAGSRASGAAAGAPADKQIPPPLPVMAAAMPAAQAHPDHTISTAAAGATTSTKTAAAAPAAFGPTADKTSLLCSHFLTFLLKILYSAKCFEHLKHFIPIFQDMQDLGCSTPCNLAALAAFAKADPLDTNLCTSTFAAEDLTSRVRFFSSVLYGDFLEFRAVSLLWAARAATTSETRLKHVDLLVSCAQSMEGEAGAAMQRTASWARTLFDPAISESAKVEFLLAGPSADILRETNKEAAGPASAASAASGAASTAAVAPGGALQKLDFAASFAVVPGDTLVWEHWAFFVQPGECPTTLTLRGFFEAMELVKDTAAARSFRNPVVLAVLSFVSDTAMLPEPLRATLGSSGEEQSGCGLLGRSG
jgi:hypothetical protein